MSFSNRSDNLIIDIGDDVMGMAFQDKAKQLQ